MSRKTKKEEYYRFFSVTDPRTHEKGHTEYKVTARIVSKKRPEDVKEVVVWKRYSELKKLHGELAYTHRNLFRRQEEFPSFPPAQLFKRFDDEVIEERRKAAEAMLLFTTNIPALYNSPQLKEFFKGGEVRRPLEPSALSSSSSLPAPLIPLPENLSELSVEEEEGREAPIQTQELETKLGETELGGDPEVAVEASSDLDSSPSEETQKEPVTEISEPERQPHNSPEQPTQVPTPEPSSPPATDQSEEFDSLFDSVAEAPTSSAAPPLSDTDLAIFDPCAKEDQPSGSQEYSELLSVPVASADGSGCGPEAEYLTKAASELNTAMDREREGDFSAAIIRYRTAVDILIRGAQEDPNPQRRDSVKRRTVQYLQHAETLLSLHTPTPTQDQKT
ncbi:sorting nexin-15 [Chanos chanos]|uniref:Sorting nexin-15 n=1 Tax=Chanos chanos TaxID=29144 RepID=A0A6J2VX08_CHACN|nr:sorting nexin-15 [Chanos chanos]